MLFAIASQLNRLRLTRISSIATITISFAVLAGWFLDVAFLKSVLPNFPEMKPNTALAFVIFGVGLIFASFSSGKKIFDKVVVVCGTLVFLIGIITFGEYMRGTSLGIDALLVPAAKFTAYGQFPGRMSPHSAFNFTLIGLSLVMLNGRWFFQKTSELFVGIVSITTFGAILGHLYGAQQFYGISNYNSMALHTAGLFIICCCALLAMNISSPVVKLLLSKSFGGVTARWFSAAVIVIPTVVERLRLVGQDYGLYDTGFGASLSQLVRVILMCSVVFIISVKIFKLDNRRKVAEELLKEKEQRYRDLFDYGQSMICIHDLEGLLTTVNPAALISLGYERDELIGRNICELMPEELKAQFPGFLRRVENEGMAGGSFTLVTKSGKRVIWQYQSILVSEPDTEPYVLGNAQDITKLVEAQKQLKNLSLTDDLTGLSNRRGFQTLAEQQIKLERHQGTARGLTLMFADLDGLKKINDQYGHEAGSDAIVAFSEVLRSALRGADIIARWGGDEFVILTIGAPGETSEAIIERIQKRLEQYNGRSSKPWVLACSIGVTPVPVDEGVSFDSLIAEADAAMYSEKRLRKAERLDSSEEPNYSTSQTSLPQPRTSPPSPTNP